MTEPASQKSALLLRTDKAGDAIKTLPALRLLLRRRPTLAVTVLASPHNASLFAFEPGIQTWVWPGADLSATRFDLAVNLMADVFPEAEAILNNVQAEKKFSGGLPSPARTEESVNIATLLGQATGVDLISGWQEVDRAPILCPSDKEEAEAVMGKKESQWLGFAPLAGNQNRTHPIGNWSRYFAQVTKDPSRQYFLFGGPGDQSRLSELARVSSNPTQTHLCFPSSFRALGAYLKRLDGFVAVDSGPLHLSLALGIPALGFLSGGDYRRWFSRLGPKDKLVRRGLLWRHPTAFEMQWASKRWLGLLFGGAL